MPNPFFRFLAHKFFPHSAKWKPFLGIFYLTYACDFRCTYCCDGTGRPYHALPVETMPLEDIISTLRIIRQHCDSLVITGGEPLQHPYADHVFEAAASMGFSDLAVTTNAFDLSAHLPALASMTQLVVSLDSLVPSHADTLYNRGEGTFSRIWANLQRADEWPNRKFKITISSVITPEFIDDVYDVYAHAKKKGWQFAACPQLNGVKVHPALQNHPKYREIFDYLISEKRVNPNIFGTTVYLEHMRDISTFECRPFTMLVVSPKGEMFYPCLELGHDAGRLIDNPNIDLLRQASLAKFGPQPKCDNRCHSACALSFSTLLNNTGRTLQKEMRNRHW